MTAFDQDSPILGHVSVVPYNTLRNTASGLGSIRPDLMDVDALDSEH
jgi:hypothetical protein